MALVDKALSEIVNEISNPVATDRMHVIRKIGSLWYSYFIEIGTIKDYSVGVQSTGVKKLGTKFGDGDEIEYISENANLTFIAVQLISGENLQIKAGITTGGEEILSLTDYITGENAYPVYFPCYESTTIYINLLGTGSAYITLVFTENLF
jgi:hypothetical protein